MQSRNSRLKHLLLHIFLFKSCFVSVRLSRETAECNKFVQVGSDPGDDCIGQELTFECCNVGPGLTVFSGGALDCSSSSDSIILLHRRFNETNWASGSCNNGSVRGRSLHTVNNAYTSQLTVVLSSNMDGTTIECQYDDGSTSRRAGVITLSVKDCSESTDNESEVTTDTTLSTNVVTTTIKEASDRNSDNDTLERAIAISVPVTVVLILWILLILCVLIARKRLLQPTIILSYPAVSASDDEQVNSYRDSESCKEKQTGVKVKFNCPGNTTIESEGHDYDAVSLESAHMSYSHLNRSIRAFRDDLDDNVYTQLETCTDGKGADNLEQLVANLRGNTNDRLYQFGCALGIDSDDMNQFDYTSKDCLFEIIDYWKRHHPGQPTLKEVVDALEEVYIYE